LRIAAAQKEIGRIETREGKIFIYPAGSRIPVTLQHAIPLLKGNTPEEKITCIIKSLPQVRRKQ
jgi:hypothetical protein